MDIKDIGGEFGLIARITDRNVPLGTKVAVGDDCAVLPYDDIHDLIVTTDMLIEGTHFRLNWSTPEQVGIKAMESNVSDIASMGGVPKWAFVSLGLKKDTSVESIESIYQGMKTSCKRHDFHIIGGDTTHGDVMVINVTILGLVKKDKAVLRSTANIGDLVCVTGDLGKSEAGLQLQVSGKYGDTKPHLEPVARSKWGETLSTYASAMIDVSDGVASDLGHICEESGVGAVVNIKDVPIAATTRNAAKKVGQDPLQWALGGGEDFELLFTIQEENVKELEQTNVKFTIIGKICEKAEGVSLVTPDGNVPLKGGYDHFKR